MTLEKWLETAKAWMDEDPDDATRATTARWIAERDAAALEAHFGGRLQFGTAGLRGVIGPGPNAMNQALVRRAAAGLGIYLLDQVEGTGQRGVVIGYDGRRGSRIFAEDTARVLAGLGIPSYLHDEVVPTPVLAHAVTELRAVAGVMVTASHNPPQDNGYKVYWGNGAQIIPPNDKGISDAIDSVGKISDLEVPELAEARSSGLVHHVNPAIFEAYVQKVLALRVHEASGIKAVYTAMHGVGWQSVTAVLDRAGHYDIYPVPEQRDPDGEFPTVNFPNPEEEGALDLAKALAREVGADLVVANDPDADRLAVCVPSPEGWKNLTGNQVGILLGADLIEHTTGKRLVATTIVSSSMLSHIASTLGVDYAEYLTGFKWIANGGLDYEKGDGRFLFGFEEALGYSAGPVVRDKDGVSALLLILDLAAHAKRQGRSLLGELERLYRRFGYYASGQKALTLPGSTGAARIQAMMDFLRATPPKELAGRQVLQIRDVAHNLRTDLVTGATSELGLPKSNVLAFDLERGARILARPSGTEPKIKFYFELREPMVDGESLETAEDRANDAMDEVRTAFLEHLGDLVK